MQAGLQSQAVRRTLLLVALVSPGCAITPSGEEETAPTGIEIHGLRIQNRSFSLVTEVMLLVVNTGEFISCGNIAMHGECSTTFPLRQYQGNRIEIRWKQGGLEWSTGEFVVDYSEGIDPGRQALVNVIITAEGLAAAKLVQ